MNPSSLITDPESLILESLILESPILESPILESPILESPILGSLILGSLNQRGDSRIRFVSAIVLKNVGLGGSRQLQFRAEASSALNRANSQNPNTTTTSTALGTITAQNGLPRQLQLAVKVSF
jgi:hypothetical protein